MGKNSIVLLIFFLVSSAFKTISYRQTRGPSTSQIPDSIRHMMQWRVREMRKIRQWLIKHPDSTLPLKPTLFYFSSGIPSDSDFITPTFFVLDTIFHNEYVKLYQNPSINQFNTVINVCESCHNTWCPGPLRLIKKFYVTLQRD